MFYFLFFFTRHTYLESKTHSQHFFFRSTLHPSSPEIQSITKDVIRVQYVLENAGEASYAKAFNGYQTFFTTGSPFDDGSWGRVKSTSYDEEKGWLIWNHEINASNPGHTAYFAYFPPYSYERHLILISRCTSSADCHVHSLGQTLSNREIDCLTIGTGPKTCWIIHRQHPGESMAEFYAEGLLTRLLDLNDDWDSVAMKARELYTFKIVPNVNPDGAIMGHLRTNAVGSNLNREWDSSVGPAEDGEEKTKYEAPTLERSPEVYHILRHMDEVGCDAFLDIVSLFWLFYSFQCIMNDFS